ncbi:response regulator [Sulfurimonas sp. SAG-AH-194-L11]|nr:response regulator [Sulfurimonas sp. SAG-AH-194-L11]MDF1877416.1 response regulator [Sulfurimonas sp. SAG-AH-194-L11]
MIDINIVKLKKYAENCSVLYVEDDELIRDQTASFLGRFFKDIVLGEDGSIGISKYKERKFDIVITDINMPNMNGIDMIREIKEINYEQIVLVTSAHNDSDYLIQLINLDVMRFILKPFNNKQFLYIIYKIAEELSVNSEKELLEAKLRQLSVRYQTIVDEINIGIVVIKDYAIDMANRAFLDIGGFDSYETLKLEMPDIGVLFEESSQCLNAATNEELISQLQELKDENRKVRMVRNAKTIEYQVNLSEIVEEENSYIITFNDITAIHNSLYNDRNTHLPNRKFILEKIEIIKQNVSKLDVILLSINNFRSIDKYYGRGESKEIEQSFANSIKIVRDTQMPKAFVGYFGVNKFIITSDSGNIKTLISMLQEIQISSLTLLKKYEHSKMEFHLSTNVILKEIDTNDSMKNIEVILDDAFEIV